MTSLDTVPEMFALIVKPDIEVSTKFVYQNLKLDSITHPDTDAVLKGLREKNLNMVCQNMGNVLATVTVKEYPVLQELMNDIDANGAVGTLMSGSGPTVFGLFDDMNKARNAEQIMLEKHSDCFVKAVEIICNE